MLGEVERLHGNRYANRIAGLPSDKKRIAIFSAICSKKDRELVELIKELQSDKVSIIDHLDKIIERYRKYNPVGKVEKLSFGEVFTPFSLIDEMLDVLPTEVWSNSNLKWADLCNGMGNFMILIVKRLMIGLENWEPNESKRYKHIIENMIYVAELQPKNMFLWMLSIDPKSKLKLNLYRGDSLSKEFDEFVKNEWKIEKFNIIVGNPPYKRKLNLKFLNKFSEICDSILYVHPASWLIDEKNINGDFNNCKKLYDKTLEIVIIFNGNPIFNIGLYIPCGVTYINKDRKSDKIEVIDKINNTKIEYSSIYDINKYSNLNEYSSIFLKIKKSKNFLSNYYNVNVGDYFINSARIRGHVNEKEGSSMYQDDFYTIITKDTIVETSKSKSVFFSFNNENDANNFKDYLKTNFCMFCLSICKNSADLNKIDFSYIPWMDFSQEWTDEKLYNYFELTSDEIKFIEKVIPKYY